MRALINAMKREDNKQSSVFVYKTMADSSIPKIEIGNYDVLVQKVEDSKYKLYEDGHVHVGNNRFHVLLNMHRGDFDAQFDKSQDTTTTVEKIIEIITTHCKPNGRFLVLDNNDHSWKLLQQNDIIGFVRDTLTESRTNKDDNLKKPPPLPQSPKDDGYKKRRRRSSLLRRSVSESVIPFRRNIEDRKKNVRTERRPSFWNSIRHRKSLIIQNPEPLDVLFENNYCLQEANNHVGNNRLQVLMDVQKDKYTQAAMEDQQSMIQDLIKTVTHFWGGRFLVQKENGYEVMNDDRAEMALQHVLSNKNTTTTVVDEKPAAKVKQEAVAAIHQFQPDVKDMRNKAIESLQKKKKRQGLASRIRNLAATTFSRSVSEPIVQRSMSEPVRRQQ